MFRVGPATICRLYVGILLCSLAPVPTRAEPRTLREVLAFARQHAPRVEARRAERAQIGAEARARGFWLPQGPSVGAEWTRRRPVEGPESRDRVFEASLALEPFGQGIFRARAASAERRLGMLELDARERSWAAEVAWRFCEHLRRDWMRDRTRRQAEVTRRLSEIVQQRLEAGDASGLDLDLARVEGAEARLRVLEAELTFRRSEEALAAAMGWPAGSPVPAPDSLELVPAFPDTTALFARAMRARPDLRIARAALDRGRAASRLAASQLFPEADLGLFDGHEEGDDVRGLRAGLTVPFLGPLLAERRARSAERRRLEADLDAALREAHAEIAAARAAMELAFQGVTLYQQEILPGIQDARQRSQEAYTLGEVDLTSVLLSEQRYRDAERSFADVLGAYSDALRELEVASGLPVLSGYQLAEEIEP